MAKARRRRNPAHAPLYAGEAVGLATAERSPTGVVRKLNAYAEKRSAPQPG
ncbi:hypothetical protein [Blastococcus sp. TF02-09]|uniref:hypothetical protein n=1 Tax=Blastococcus sp. TF02-09 TaxID=2250576 RepID=UPI001314B3DF|nr:hypothetical protein [Blastococcus sp. TF02-9]